MPVFLMLGVFAKVAPFESTKLKPLLLMTVPPALTLETLRSGFNLKPIVVVPSSVLAVVVKFCSPVATPIST